MKVERNALEDIEGGRKDKKRQERHRRRDTHTDGREAEHIHTEMKRETHLLKEEETVRQDTDKEGETHRRSDGDGRFLEEH